MLAAWDSGLVALTVENSRPTVREWPKSDIDGFLTIFSAAGLWWIRHVGALGRSNRSTTGVTTMRIRLGCSRRLIVAALAAVALATPKGAAAAEDRSEDWSFGAGVGNLFSAPLFDVVPVGSDSIMLVPQTSSAAKPVTFSVERRLAPNLWLGLRADVQTTSAKSNPPDRISVIGEDTMTRHSTSENSFTSWGASLGVRYVLNPGSIVEFSPFLAVGLTGGSSKVSETGTTKITGPNAETTSMTTEQTTSSIGPTGGVGFAVEAFLGRGVSVRFSTLLASLAATSSESDSKRTSNPPETPNPNQPVQPTKSTGSMTSLGLTLTPALELRVAL